MKSMCDNVVMTSARPGEDGGGYGGGKSGGGEGGGGGGKSDGSGGGDGKDGGLIVGAHTTFRWAVNAKGPLVVAQLAVGVELLRVELDLTRCAVGARRHGR